METKNNSVRGQIIAMEVGDTLAFPVDVKGYATVRAYASDLSFLYFRRYKTHRDRETRQVIITRVQ